MNAIPELYKRHRISVDDYHRMGETGILAHDARVELINGEIIDMAPIGNQHMSKVDRLVEHFVLKAMGNFIVRSQGSVRLSNFSEPQPDLLLLKRRADFYAERSASSEDILLLIEFSESSLQYDMTVKLPLYALEGVPEVWIVDITARRLLRYADPVDGQWQFEDSPDELFNIVPNQLSNISLDLTTLF